jgi:predicted Rossmann-fold nucleotide-binding protein
MNRVIFFGANTNYYCIHGGGDGTMLAVTLGIKYVDYEAKNCHIIIPEFMMLKDTDAYDIIGKKEIVDTIHNRIGRHIEVSEGCKYVIVYAGGIGTLHEILSILVHWYTKPDDMPIFLICNEDGEEWCRLLAAMLSPLCVPERQYMITMRKKIFNLTTDELIDVLKNPDALSDKNLLMT